MCGLVGVLSTEINSFQHSYGKFFKQALFADTLRGFDSTGIFVMDTDKMDQPEVYKKAIAAPDFLQLAHTNALLRDTRDWNIMIGHNRHATKGGIDHHTAHPFQVGDITLVHNGTIDNHRILPNGNKFDVDSEAIADAINDIGIEEVVRKISGAFTFIWHDRRNGSLNFIRNDERPLAFGKVKDKKTILMSSEANMLRWLALRNGLPLESIMEPKPGELFVWMPYKDSANWAEKPEVKALELRPKNFYQGGQGTYNHHGHNNHGYKGTTQKKSSTGRSSSSTGKAKETNSGTLSKDAQDILNELSLDQGEEVCLTNLTWDPYPGSKNQLIGRVIGEIEDVADHHLAVIHGVDKHTWENHVKGMYAYSKVLSAGYDALKTPMVFLDNQDYSVLDPSELPNHSTINYDEDNDEDSREVNKALTVITFRGFNGEKLSLREFERATKDGCAYCTGDIKSEDHEKTGWTHDRQPVCKECIKTHDLGEYLH